MPSPSAPTPPPREPESLARLHARLEPVATLLGRIELLEELSRRQSPGRAGLVDAITRRQVLAEVAKRLANLRAADVGHLMETLRPDHRRIAWEQLTPEAAGLVLWEVPAPMAAALLEETPRERVLAAAKTLDADGLAYLAPSLPRDVVAEVDAALEPRTRAWLVAAAAHPEGTAGRLMSHDLMVVAGRETVRDVLKTLRRLPELPTQADAVYVVDDRDRFVGAVRLETLLRRPLRQRMSEVADREVLTFRPGEAAGDEDLLGPIWLGARQRWPWLAVNLCTAFLASRVIGAFEGSIAQLVALAALMPIVASIGGNTGNQTATLFIRGLALDQLSSANLGTVALKEAAIALLNGLVWGPHSGWSSPCSTATRGWGW